MLLGFRCDTDSAAANSRRVALPSVVSTARKLELLESVAAEAHVAGATSKATREWCEKVLAVLRSTMGHEHPTIAKVNKTTALVDTTSFAKVRGSVAMPHFPSYFIAERGGRRPEQAAVHMLKSWCDHALHLDGYEGELAGLEPASTETMSSSAPVRTRAATTASRQCCHPHAPHRLFATLCRDMKATSVWQPEATRLAVTYSRCARSSDMGQA